MPVLAVTRIGGQSFVYVAAPQGAWLHGASSIGDAGRTGRQLLSGAGGLRPGDRVILSGIQFLQEGVPVQPMAGCRPPPRRSPEPKVAAQ